MRNYLLKFLLVFAGSLAWFGTRSQEVKGDDKTLSPYFFIPGNQEAVEHFPLMSTSADVNIAGVMADVKVTQVYRNNGTVPIEATYIFPGSTRAAVYDLSMTIGERIIKAKIEERAKARQQYTEALAQGKSASLLEQERPNVFQMSVGNIMPGDEIKVELYYTETLIPEGGVYEFVYPTVVGPRYSNQPAATASNDLWVANPYLHEGKPSPYEFNLTAGINTGIPLNGLRCTSHETTINYSSPSNAAVVLKSSEKLAGNKDFILQYRLKGEQIQSGLLLYEGEKENFFMMMVQPPKRVAPEVIPPREYVFIVDVSGSMNGFPLEVSKTLLRDLIGNLKPTDCFNVILFAGSAHLMSPSSLPATSANIAKAIDVLDKRRGGGGTELLPALKTALALKTPENYSRSFVIATDGYVTVEKEAFDLIRENLGEANFFTFGIGSSVNRYLLEGMARTGMGEPFIVTRQEESAAIAEKFRTYIQSPVLTNITVSYDGFDAYDIEPASVPDVLADRPVMIYGKYRGVPKGKVVIKGESGEGVFEKVYALSTVKSESKNAALRYIWARNRISMLDDYRATGRSASEIAEEVTKLGLDYNLLTAYTSFLAVDSEVRNKEGGQVTVKQPLPLPQGVSDYAVGNSAGKVTTGTFKREDRVRSSRLIEKDATMEMSVQEIKPAYEPAGVPATVQPFFPGGQAAIDKWIRENLVYPASEKVSKTTGTVYLEVVILKDGSIGAVKVLRGINDALNNEAIRLIKKMPKWIPGKSGNVVQEMVVKIPVKFSL